MSRFYPPTLFSTLVLSNTPIPVGPAGSPLSFDWVVVTGGALGHLVLFQTRAAVVHFFLRVPAKGRVPLGGLKLSSDLEVRTLFAAGDVGLQVAYF